MLRTLFTVTILIAVMGCRRNPEEEAVSEPAPPPAAALANRGQSLDASLKDLEHELSMTLGSGFDGDGLQHFLTAEAITDRLLEAQQPFAWLATSYSLESQVRQIQALADRVVAEIRSGVDHTVVREEVTSLRRKVIDLRKAIAMGGGRAPVPLDSLMAGTSADSTIVSEAGGE